MELKIESMKNMKKTVEKCLDELMKKTDLTPAETKTALDALKLYDELCCRIEDCINEEDNMTRGYSENAMPHRQYHISSYGLPERAYSERYNGYTNSMNNGMHRQGSQGGYQYDNYPMHYDGMEYSERRGYSRHSISDRVVSMVENMMDSAESDYERQELQKYIRAIRAMGMTD